MAKTNVARAGKGRAARPIKKSGPSRPATKPRKSATSKRMTHEDMIAAWQKAMTPSEGHRRLEPMLGTWTARSTFCMTADSPPDIGEAISENRWVLGGRYLEQVYRGTAGGMPFEGIGFTGFDNVQGKYVGTWMDSFGTGLMNSIGTGTPTGEEIESEATSLDPSGKLVRFWCKVRIKDRDHHSFEMWTKAPGGRRFRTMLIEYTRR